MADNFGNRQSSLESPASRAFAITPGTPFSLATRAIYIGGDGDLVCRLVGDSADVTFVGLVAGTVLPIRVTSVAVATDATNILGLL